MIKLETPALAIKNSSLLSLCGSTTKAGETRLYSFTNVFRLKSVVKINVSGVLLLCWNEILCTPGTNLQ